MRLQSVELVYMQLLLSLNEQHGRSKKLWCTSLASWCSTACTVKHLCASWNCANQLQASHRGNIISDLPPDSSWSYHTTGSVAIVDGFFCVAGPLVWNSLPDNLRDLVIDRNNFGQSLKMFLFTTYLCFQRIRGFMTMHHIN